MDEKERQEADQQFQKQLQDIRMHLLRLLESNEKAPGLEQLSKEEFLLDLEEKAKLEQEMNTRIQQVRDEINKKNCTKRVLYQRLKVTDATLALIYSAVERILG
jgi:hypothetical protein